MTTRRVTQVVCFNFVCHCLLFVVFKDQRTHLCNHQFQGEVMEHQQRMLRWISNYRYSYTMEEEACLHTYFGYIWCRVLLVDEPHVPLITIEANALYHYPFDRTSECDITHIISYYDYFQLARQDNLLQFLQQFFGHDVNERPTRSTFRQDTTVEVQEDVGDLVIMGI